MIPGLETATRVTGALKGIAFALFATAVCVVLAAMSSFGGPPEGQKLAVARWRELLPQPVRTLCLWYVPDEAFWLLRFARLFPAWVHWLVSANSRYPNSAITVAATLIACWFAWTSGTNASAGVSSIYAAVAALRVPFYAGCAMIAVPVTLWAVSVLLSAGTMVALGSYRFMDHLWLDIHTERRPQIADELVCAPRVKLRGAGWIAKLRALPLFTGSLIHSGLYTDDRTPEFIAKWYKAGSLTITAAVSDEIDLPAPK